MKYSYQLGLALVNPSTEIDLTAYQAALKQAVASYNAKQEKAANRKTLVLAKITSKELVVSLDSQAALTAPAKALRTFSQIIVEEFPDLASKLLYHNHLFRSFPLIDSSQIEHARIESTAVDISDQKLLEAMVRLCMKSLKDRTAQETHVLSEIKYLLYREELL